MEILLLTQQLGVPVLTVFFVSMAAFGVTLQVAFPPPHGSIEEAVLAAGAMM